MRSLLALAKPRKREQAKSTLAKQRLRAITEGHCTMQGSRRAHSSASNVRVSQVTRRTPQLRSPTTRPTRPAWSCGGEKGKLAQLIKSRVERGFPGLSSPVADFPNLFHSACVEGHRGEAGASCCTHGSALIRHEHLVAGGQLALCRSTVATLEPCSLAHVLGSICSSSARPPLTKAFLYQRTYCSIAPAADPVCSWGGVRSIGTTVCQGGCPHERLHQEGADQGPAVPFF